MSKRNQTDFNNEFVSNFLKFSYFGDYEDKLQAASDRAYRDMCRTLRFNGYEKKKRVELRKKVTNEIFMNALNELFSIKNISQEDYDSWHERVCKKIVDLYGDKVDLKYGQAQKWVNMTMKYLYILDYQDFTNLLDKFHAPIDNFVIDAVTKKIINKRDNEYYICCKKPQNIWSSMDSGEYKTFQKDIRENLKKKNTNPFEWELKNFPFK